MNTSERKRLHPLPNTPRNTSQQPNTTRNTTKEVVPKQPFTSTQRNKNKPTQPSIAAAAIATIIAVFAFKKGYITIEVVDEENPQETSDDYTISILS